MIINPVEVYTAQWFISLTGGHITFENTAMTVTSKLDTAGTQFLISSHVILVHGFIRNGGAGTQMYFSGSVIALRTGNILLFDQKISDRFGFGFGESIITGADLLGIDIPEGRHVAVNIQSPARTGDIDFDTIKLDDFTFRINTIEFAADIIRTALDHQAGIFRIQFIV